MTAFTRRSLLIGTGGALLAETTRLPRKVRVAIIGLDGHPGEITKPLDRLPDVEIVAISDANQNAVRRFISGKASLAQAKPYTDYQKMLDVEKMDVVAVCNNNGDRAAAILECTQRRLNVIAEKPLAITRRDFERVKKAVQESGIQLGMLLPMRYEPSYQALHKIVQSGEIGEVIQISSQKSYKLGDRPEWFKHQASYGSTILWIGIHMIDLMRWTSGATFTEVSSFMGRAGFENVGDMETSTATNFRLQNGGSATLHMDYCLPATASAHGDDRLRLAGTRGIAEYMGATGVTLITSKAKLHRIESLPEEGSVFADYLAHVYNGVPATLTLDDIYAACELTIAAHESAVEGRVVKMG